MVVDEDEFDFAEEEAEREKHESYIASVHEAINEKEVLLNSIKDAQKKMQEELMTMMTQQYAEKVTELEKEISELSIQP